SRRVRAFFEEWHEPLIAGIRWCSELLELVGADAVCRESSGEHGADGRVFAPEEGERRGPDVGTASWCGRKVRRGKVFPREGGEGIASWCGRKAKREKIGARPGWEQVSAVRQDQLYEVKSTFILQPGPAALTDGVDQLARIVSAVARGEHLPAKAPGELRQ